MKKVKIAPAYPIMLLVMCLDQLSKYLVRTYMELYHSIPVLEKLFGDTFMLTHVQNSGAAFSIGFNSPATNRIFFIIITILAVVFIFFLLYKSTHYLQVLAFGMVLGGAMGNLIDRVLRGAVTDFINVDFPDFIMERFPIFNIADSSIFIAVCLLLLDLIIHKQEPEATQETEQSEYFEIN